MSRGRSNCKVGPRLVTDDRSIRRSMKPGRAEFRALYEKHRKGLRVCREAGFSLFSPVRRLARKVAFRAWLGTWWPWAALMVGRWWECKALRRAGQRSGARCARRRTAR